MRAALRLGCRCSQLHCLHVVLNSLPQAGSGHTCVLLLPLLLLLLLLQCAGAPTVSLIVGGWQYSQQVGCWQ